MDQHGRHQPNMFYYIIAPFVSALLFIFLLNMKTREDAFSLLSFFHFEEQLHNFEWIFARKLFLNNLLFEMYEVFEWSSIFCYNFSALQ